MKYATALIGGSTTLATFVAVYQLFGPTYPGTSDKDRGVCYLFYPGLSFTFSIPTQYENCCNDREADLPLEFPDGTTPVTSRVCIYDGSTGKKVVVGSLMDKAMVSSLHTGSLYMEEVHVKELANRAQPYGFEVKGVATLSCVLISSGVVLRYRKLNFPGSAVNISLGKKW